MSASPCRWRPHCESPFWNSCAEFLTSPSFPKHFHVQTPRWTGVGWGLRMGFVASSVRHSGRISSPPGSGTPAPPPFFCFRLLLAIYSCVRQLRQPESGLPARASPGADPVLLCDSWWRRDKRHLPLLLPELPLAGLQEERPYFTCVQRQDRCLCAVQ